MIEKLVGEAVVIDSQHLRLPGDADESRSGLPGTTQRRSARFRDTETTAKNYVAPRPPPASNEIAKNFG